jgi:hypothetical protein
VDTITISAGESINGVISCSPNARNPRDLDIAIEYEVKGAHPSKGEVKYKMYVHPFFHFCTKISAFGAADFWFKGLDLELIYFPPSICLQSHYIKSSTPQSPLGPPKFLLVLGIKWFM